MDKYEFLMELGSGSFGRVIKVRSKKEPSTPLAIKIIKLNGLNEKQKNSALNEIRLLASIDSPNVIAYHDAFFQDHNNTLCIVMEYADGGDLAGMIKRKRQKGQQFNQNFIWQVAFDLLKALKTLHNSKIIHRDLKPGNVFFVDGVAKLGDLNISKVAEGGFASTQAGTPYYTSPQIWNGLLYDGKCDIWSLGCLIYECSTLRPPFLANDFPSLSKKINMGYFDPIPITYSKRLYDVIKHCLRVNFKERPSASELMKDPVFQYMHSTEQGTVNLLNTIRCPRILKMIQQKLPTSKSNLKVDRQASRLTSPSSHYLRKLVSEEKTKESIIHHNKENETSRYHQIKNISKESSPQPSRGILFRAHSPQVRHHGVFSPIVNRRGI